LIVACLHHQIIISSAQTIFTQSCSVSQHNVDTWTMREKKVKSSSTLNLHYCMNYLCFVFPNSYNIIVNSIT